MASGVEVVGLALAVVPLFIEAAKVYSDGIEAIADVVVKSRWDERLEEFYLDFYMQLLYLDEALQRLRDALGPGLFQTGDKKQQLKLLSNWQYDTDMTEALRQYFGSNDRFNAFTIISKKIMTLLQQLVKDKTNRVTTQDRSDQAMFGKLKELAIARELGSTSSSFLERFAFFRHREKREQCIKKLATWVKNLEKLTKQAEKSPSEYAQTTRNNTKPKFDPVKPRKPPLSKELRDLIANLHPALREHSNCSCSEQHEIKLCLKDSYESADLYPCLKIDLLLSGNFDTGSTRDIRWQEANVFITSQCSSNANQLKPLSTLCEACDSDLGNYSLALVFEDTSTQQRIKRRGADLRKLRFQESFPPITLSELLDGSTKLDPREKRTLALIFAESLLLYHDSAWMSANGGGWAKDDICFFFQTEDEPDVAHPFLSARFDNASITRKDPFRNASLHRNPSILALGILLIEIFNEKPIEKWRTPRERKDPAVAAATTAWMVADRVVKKMDQSPSREAIEACLDLDWIPAGRGAGLDDQETRMGLLENVIAPLKQEMKWLSVNKLS
ncbi:hypothetical protein BFW01_g8239 [Lasiodiplodia theobromae]|uniref:uncharacterized protein n=1 Tax=Lasiodiplodia theobromae TaxID=45133 RepID=UPI0015C34048|nr:uncharacterized protein LTHEOB_1322 [Lasiodiplodia theobromae]KAF4538968.1 hypothetical protein LTHEOB_1322 [Lasiodiplodia theobromae]KAF9637343.1 hypothetical protein BFW01_g8239 [Lasiodiplodia theobromae]